MTFYDEGEFDRSPPANFSGKWAFECLDDCWDGKIKVTDLDGIVERKGKFLIFETKKESATMPRGQQILFAKLLETGLFTLLLIWGKPGVTEIKSIQLLHRNRRQTIEPSLEALQKVCRRWFNWANRGGLERVK